MNTKEESVKPVSKTKVSSKIIVSSKALYKLLVPLAKVVNKNTVLPVLSCFMLEYDKPSRKLTVHATNLENYMTNSMDCDGNGSFRVCVESSDLFGFMRDSEDAPTSIIVDYDTHYNVKIIQDACSLTIAGEPPENFPKAPKIEEGVPYKEWSFSYKIMMPQMKKALLFVSNDDLRPAMTGVYIHDDGSKGLMMVATDAHRLYFTQLSATTPIFMKGSKMIIIRSACQLMTTFFSKGETIHFKITETFLFATSGNITLSTRLIDAKYPDYSVVMVNYDTCLYLKRKQFIAFLKLADNFTNKSTHQIAFSVLFDRIMAKCADVDFSKEFTYTIPHYNSKNLQVEFEFGFNIRFMLEALTVSTEDYVKLSTGMSSTKAFVIDDTILVMPLMLNQ